MDHGDKYLCLDELDSRHARVFEIGHLIDDSLRALESMLLRIEKNRVPRADSGRHKCVRGPRRLCICANAWHRMPGSEVQHAGALN